MCICNNAICTMAGRGNMTIHSHKHSSKLFINEGSILTQTLIYFQKTEYNSDKMKAEVGTNK